MKTLLLSLALFICFSAVAQPSDAYIQGIMTAGHIPGAGAVVIKDGHWIYNKSFGKANIDANQDVTRGTVFMLASISKTMIVTAVMKLWEQGRIQLDRDINQYLPFQMRIPNHPTDTMTMRMLLTHTSGVRDNYNILNALYVNGDSPVSLDSLTKNYFVQGGSYYANANYYTYHAGAGYNYSNMGSTLAAYIVERVTGDDYGHYCDTAIFAHLCMDNSSLKLAGFTDTTIIARPYSWTGTDYVDQGLYGYADYPDGQMRTNITSLARFMAMYMQYGMYEGYRMLDSSTVRMIMKQQFSVAPGQGLIFHRWRALNGDTIWGHNGGDAGVSTAMYFSYNTKTGGIVLTNADGDPANNMETIFDTLYKYGVSVTPTPADTFPSCTFSTAIAASAAPVSHELSVFPNPASDLLHVECNLEEASDVVMYDLLGNCVLKQAMKDRHSTIHTGHLKPGLYLVGVMTEGASSPYSRVLIVR